MRVLISRTICHDGVTWYSKEGLFSTDASPPDQKLNKDPSVVHIMPTFLAMFVCYFLIILLADLPREEQSALVPQGEVAQGSSRHSAKGSPT